jgi:hypothetical protein
MKVPTPNDMEELNYCSTCDKFIESEILVADVSSEFNFREDPALNYDKFILACPYCYDEIYQYFGHKQDIEDKPQATITGSRAREFIYKNYGPRVDTKEKVNRRKILSEIENEELV